MLPSPRLAPRDGSAGGPGMAHWSGEGSTLPASAGPEQRYEHSPEHGPEHNKPTKQPKSKTWILCSFDGHPHRDWFYRSSGPSLALPRSHPWALVAAKPAPVQTPFYPAEFCTCDMNKDVFILIPRILELTRHCKTSLCVHILVSCRILTMAFEQRLIYRYSAGP